MPADNPFVRIIFCDLAGIRRCRVIPLTSLKKARQSNGINVTRSIMAMNAYSDHVAPEAGLDVIGDVLLILDREYKSRGRVDALKISPYGCSWYPAHSIQVGTLYSTPGEELGNAKEPWTLCPRAILSKVLDQAHQLLDAFDMEIRCGHEIEFYLLHAQDTSSPGVTKTPQPIDRSVYAQSTAVDAAAPVLDSIVSALKVLGIEVEQYHAESGPGQFEIVLKHERCDIMADKILMARETIACVAAQNKLVATFLPKPFQDKVGSGAHTHLSLQYIRPDHPTSYHKHLHSYFLAGLLHHLPALYVFIAPSPTSYWRLQPDTWSGAYRFWGNRHKEAPLRLCTGISEQHIEVKGVDNTCNPHIAIAALIQAGLQGIKSQVELPPPFTTTPRPEDNLERLPGSLESAIEAFENDAEFKDCLKSQWSEEFVTAFMGVRKEEARISSTLSIDAQTSQLLQRY